MSVDVLETKAHELIGQLNPVKLEAVVHLLEIMVQDDPLTEEDRLRFHSGRASLKDGSGISMDAVLAEFDLKPTDFPLPD